MNIFLITRLLLSCLPVTVMSPLLLQNVVFTPVNIAMSVDIACSNVIPLSLLHADCGHQHSQHLLYEKDMILKQMTTFHKNFLSKIFIALKSSPTRKGLVYYILLV